MKRLFQVLVLFVPVLIISALLMLANIQTLFADSGVSAADISQSLGDVVFGPMTEDEAAALLAEETAAAEAQAAQLPDDILAEQILGNMSPVLMNNDIMAFYGHPNAASMGIIGQHPLEDLEPLLNDFAAEYDAVNGSRGTVKALYLIFGTCWPEGEIGYLNEKTIQKYVDFAAERNWLVFLDHQIGKYSVEYAVKRLLPYLKYENVHLALDPEWRTTKPMQEIGWVTAAEVNTAQQMIQDYLIENGLPGKRMLVIHQFKPWMISERQDVKSNYKRVNLIHCADGFGNPNQKKDSYAMNAQAKNIPLKSFKLFSKPAIAGAGYDQPMMSPEEVLALNPRPCLIMIQ